MQKLFVYLAHRDTTAQISHLIIVVLKVWMLTLELNHLQPGDPLLLFGCHQITVRIPPLWFSAKGSYFCINILSTSTKLTEYNHVIQKSYIKHQPWKCALFVAK